MGEEFDRIVEGENSAMSDSNENQPKPLLEHYERLLIGQKQIRNALKQLAAQRDKIDIEVLANQHMILDNQAEVATTLREVHSTNRHTWCAVAWINGELYQAPVCELDVFDRVGGGDGFASGMFYGIIAGAEPEQAVRLGWAHGALLTSYPGDTTMATREQVIDFAKGGTARIQR